MGLPKAKTRIDHDMYLEMKAERDRLKSLLKEYRQRLKDTTVAHDELEEENERLTKALEEIVEQGVYYSGDYRPDFIDPVEIAQKALEGGDE